MQSDVHYRVHKSPPLVPILSQISPVHELLSSFLKIRFKIRQHLDLLNGLFPLRFSYQNTVCTSPAPRTCHMTRPSYPFWFDHPNIWWGVQMRNSSLWSSWNLNVREVSIKANHCTVLTVTKYSSVVKMFCTRCNHILCYVWLPYDRHKWTGFFPRIGHKKSEFSGKRG
jgi:hypothetical protein